MPLDIVRIFALLTGAVIIVLLLALWGYRFAVTSRRRRKTGVVSRYRSVLHRMAECDPEDLEGLQKAMEGVPPGDRETLVESLARVKDTPLSTYSRLLDALGVTDRYVERVRRARGWKERAMAAEALGRIGSARAVPALLEVVRDRKDEDEEVRGVALRALGRIRDERAIPFLIEALGDEESWIPPRVAEIIHAFGREAVPYLVNELKNYENATRRMWAAEILGWIGEKSAASPLLDALGDVNPEVRAKAAGALGRLKDPRAIPRLVEMLVSDPVPFVRVRTAQALGQIGHPSIIDYLVNILRDPEWWVRVRAVEALEQMGQPAIPSLLAALEDEDEEVRKKAAQALERMGYVERVMAGYGEEEFRPELRKILFLILKAGVTESISERVLTSEGILQKRLIRLLGEAGEKKSAGVLVELLRKTDDWTLQSRIIQSLGNMGAREAAHYLVGFLRSEHYWVRRATVEALEKIGAVEYATHVSELLRDPNPMARESAATALAAMGVREAWQKIVPLLDDPVPEVRAAALEAVRKLGGDLTPEKVRSLLRDTSSAVRKEGLTFAADRGMREVVEDAVKSLLSGDEGEAERAVDYLRRTGPHPFSTIADLLGGEGDDRTLPLLRAASVTKSPEAEEFIRKKITHAEGAVRSAAYRALISSGAAKEGDLLSGLRDPDE
ncbi:MAG: HEAT repeat domain-containing protein, partial [Deltaproteobacteria bacterium]